MVYNMEMDFFAILNLKHHASASMQCINALTFCKESHKSVQTYLSLTNREWAGAMKTGLVLDKLGLCRVVVLRSADMALKAYHQKRGPASTKYR
jgi:hypothetical protein